MSRGGCTEHHLLAKDADLGLWAEKTPRGGAAARTPLASSFCGARGRGTEGNGPSLLGDRDFPPKGCIMGNNDFIPSRRPAGGGGWGEWSLGRRKETQRGPRP